MILARKDLFRRFLADNGFNVPRSESFYDVNLAREYATSLNLPLFIKPVDSSGSKGVTRLEEIKDFTDAFTHALGFSREKKVVVEEAIVRHGYQVAGDGFVVDGKLVFRSWANEHFDKLCNGLVPIGESFPAIHDNALQNVAHQETQRLLDLLGIKTGALNFDFIFTVDGKFYFLELGPRNGGNLIPEVIRYANNVDLIKYTIDVALGEDCSSLVMTETRGFHASYIVHALEDGICKDVYLSERIRPKIIEQNLLVNPGDSVRNFSGSNDTLGTMILRFDSQDEMLDMMDNMERDIRVELA
jgi:biotin carboxylase